jgi:aerobic carbon-monoxide dehydrogenase medium subunit
MKPMPFEYHPVTTVSEATSLLAELGEEGRILAGGQSLVPLMNFRLAQPEHLVDINPITNLAYIRAEDGRVAIGALARQATVERSEDVRRHVPLLAEALGLVAHPPIRHRGTVVGSIAHADPAAEMPSAAVALGARITLASAQGERTVAAEDFFLGPFETAARTGELLTEIDYPVAPAATGFAFMEFARRHGDFAIAGAAAAITLEGDRIAAATIVLCGVGSRPLRALNAEQSLIGVVPLEATIEAAASEAVAGLEPAADIHGGTEYRVRVARAQVRKAITRAAERAAGSK